jgi:two-component system, chemotaxis family, chemotaxis protein CheY
MRALIVDDSRAIRTIIRGIVKELGFETVEAGHGREALDRLKQTGAVDLALVDWNMPEMNGFEFVQAVRADRAFDGTRLVMVTTETEMADVARALEAGANEYLMKPFTKDAMVEKLAMLGLIGS